MRSLYALIFALGLALLAQPVIAGSGAPFLKPPDVEAKPGDTRPNGQDPPADAESDGDVEKRLKKLLEILRTGDDTERRKAVAELETVHDPRAAEALWAGVRRLMGPLKGRCAAALAALATDFPDSGIGKEIASYLDEALRKLRANTDPGVAFHFLDHLFLRDRSRALDHARAFLPMLMGPPELFDLLLRHSGTDSLELLAVFAARHDRRSTAVRTGAIRTLGRFGNGPPLYSVRVPALLACLRDPSAAAEAEKSLRAVCFARLTGTGAWSRWWRDRGDKSDADIAWAELSEALGVHGEDMPDALRAVDGWVGEWKDPRFRWAVPVLHKLLRDARAHPLRATVVSILVGIGDPASLPELERTEKILDPATEKSALVQIIKGSARLALAADDETRSATGARLMEKLDSIHPRIVRGACEAMGTLGFSPAEDKLASIMRRPGRGETASAAAQALGAMGATSKLGEILETLAGSLQGSSFEDGQLARGAIRAVGSLGVPSPEAVNVLLASMGSEDERTALEAVAVLGESWRRPEAEGPIARFFDDGTRSHPARLRALEILALYPPGAGTRALIRAAGLELDREHRSNYDFARVARERLSLQGSVLPEHREDLVRVASSAKANPNGRGLCLRLLEREGIWDELTVLDAAVEALDAETDVSGAATEVLEARPSVRAMDLLISALPDVWKVTPDVQDTWKAHLLWTYGERLPHHLRPPDFGPNKKAWRQWFERNRHKLQFTKRR